MPGKLDDCIAEFTAWRTRMVTAVDEFRGWQDTYGNADIEQSLRLYDLVEGLRNDSIRLAFIGDSAEDKIGLINALLFSDVPGGLLPLGSGAEFLCATEIFHDSNEPPYVRVLPMETRKKHESIATLRRVPVEWITMRLNADSTESVAEAMRNLVESRVVGIDEARSLNLANFEPNGDAVSIPAWRYALINLPHPALRSGLNVLYSPGTQALSAEPEITFRIASSAQSLILTMGRELSPGIGEIWSHFVQGSHAHKFVVLDEGAGANETQAAGLSRVLDVPSANIVSMPVKQAVAARMAGGGHPLQVAEGVVKIEQMHAEKVVPDRRTYLLGSIAREIAPLVQAARQAVAARFISTYKSMQDLTSSAGKNKSVALDMLTRLETERKNYQKSVATFNVTYANLMARGQELIAALHDERIQYILSHDKEFIQGAWTTAGMWKNMQGLFAYFTLQVDKILNYAIHLKESVDKIYEAFHQNFGLAKLSPPRLNLEKYREEMQALEVNTRRFCHDPINIAKYKDFVLKNFYDGLVEEARQQFELTRLDTERWLRGALGPLKSQILERQTLMLRRVEQLRALKDNGSIVQERLKQLGEQRQSLKRQADHLDQLRADLVLGTSVTSTDAQVARV